MLVTPPDWYGLRLRREVPEAADAFFAGPFLAAAREAGWRSRLYWNAESFRRDLMALGSEST